MITDPSVAHEMAAKVERLLDENLVSARAGVRPRLAWPVRGPGLLRGGLR
jgi:hypothetical protein